MAEKESYIKIVSKDGFELLFNDYYGQLCSYANSFLNSVEDSEEVVQEVFFKLWTKRETIAVNTSFKQYLYRSVRNTCYNSIRHRKVKDSYKNSNQDSSNESARSSEDEVLYSEMEERLYKAIDNLPPQRKKAFVMSRYDGLKYHEIASEMDVSVKTVEKHLVKALQHLRTELKDYLPMIMALSIIHYLIVTIKNTLF